MSETYDPSCFSVSSPEEARQIILTPQDSTTEDRWARETPYLLSLIADHMDLTLDSVILDYGCGIGRIAREIIAEFGCRVIGVDISESMRRLAVDYVGSDLFDAVSPAELDALLEAGLAFDGCYSVWVLQHCHRPQEDVGRISSALKKGGVLVIVNNLRRAVPTGLGFEDDGIDVQSLLTASFNTLAEGRLSPIFTTERLARQAFWHAGIRP